MPMKEMVTGCYAHLHEEKGASADGTGMLLREASGGFMRALGSFKVETGSKEGSCCR